MTINQINNPSFGRIYCAANSKTSMATLRKYMDVVKAQKDALQRIDEKDYDVFLLMRNQAYCPEDKSKHVLTVEIRKKIEAPFVDAFTPLLLVKKNEPAIKSFIGNTDISKGIETFFNKIKDSLC